MFEQLSARLQAVMKRLRGVGKLTERDVDEALREVRLALLEADVHYRVVKDFVARVRERAVGQAVMESLTPGQQVIKLVQDELTQLLGGAQARIAAAGSPTVVMLVGLQGSGKTTTAAKLALHLKGQGRRPLMAGLDTSRPAAMEQLATVAAQAGAPALVGDPMPQGSRAALTSGGHRDPEALAREAVSEARRRGCDALILDTAGRLHVDDALMEELVRIKAAVRPHEVLLVVDAMTGQDAVRVAEEFGRRVGLDGLILTKLDGDARGGAALSARAVTGCPIKFAGVGEKLDALEAFHPDRMASRILGMGDVLSLIERAEKLVDADRAKALEEKLRTAQFTLEDFLDQLKQVRNMGPLDQLLGMIPGAAQLKGGLEDVDPRSLDRVEAIILSMTPAERRQPQTIDASRRRRIARGSGTSVQDVNRLLKQFEDTKKLMKQLGGAGRGTRGVPAKGGSGRRGPRMRGPFRLPFG